MTINLAKERKAFEQWAVSSGLSIGRAEVNEDWYWNDYVQALWQGWKIRAAIGRTNENRS